MSDSLTSKSRDGLPTRSSSLFVCTSSDPMIVTSNKIVIHTDSVRRQSRLSSTNPNGIWLSINNGIAHCRKPRNDPANGTSLWLAVDCCGIYHAVGRVMRRLSTICNEEKRAPPSRSKCGGSEWWSF